MEAPLPAEKPDLLQDNALKLGSDNKEQAITTVPLEDFPRGYPRMAAFQSSEPCFSMYRSFGYLHCRVLLELQDELRELEKQLEASDKGFAGQSSGGADGAPKHRAIEQSKETDQPGRHMILEQLREKLVAYDEVLTKARELNHFEKPSTFWEESFGVRRYGVTNRASRNLQQYGLHGLLSHKIRNKRLSSMAQRLATAASFATCNMHTLVIMHVPVASASLTPVRRSMEPESTSAYFDASIPDYIITCAVFVYLSGSYYFGRAAKKYALTLSLTSAIFWLAMVSEEDARFTTSYRWNTLKIWLGTALAFGCLSCQAYIEDANSNLPAISPSAAAARKQSLLYRFLLQLFAVSTLIQVIGMALQSFRNGCFLNALPPCLTLGILVASNIPHKCSPTLCEDIEAASGT